MAKDEKFDETIGSWLEETAPTGLPERVLAATFERTRRSKQENGWRALLGRLQMPRFVPALGGAAVVVTAAVLALTLLPPLLGPAGVPTPSPSPTASPSEAPEVTALLNGFLEARVAGEGAQPYLGVPAEAVPLLYATTSGAPYERAEFDQVQGVEWPAGLSAHKVRLFAGATVVEQLFFLWDDELPLGLGYLPDGFGAEIAPTTEDGRPVPRLFRTLDDQVTLEVARPWVAWIWGTAPWGYGQTAIRLMPAGQVRATIDGASRGDWDYFDLAADPVWVGTDCRRGPDPADAAALAESIRSDLGLEATAPVAVGVGGTEAVMMDVKIDAEAPLCVLVTDEGSLDREAGLLHNVYDLDRGVWIQGERIANGVATGEWMRLYLVDVPDGLSMRILVIAIVAPESRFESTVEAAAPVLDSVEFHAP